MQGIFAIVLMTGFTSFPLIFAWVMYANLRNLNTEVIQNKIGSMYLGVWIEGKSNFGLSLSIVFLIRRSIFVAITFALYNHPGIQIQLFIFGSILYIIYLNSRRIYKEYFMFKFEFMNECIFLIICYHLVLFTNILTNDPYTLEHIGTSMIVSIIILSIITAYVLLYLTCRIQYEKLRIKWIKKKY